MTDRELLELAAKAAGIEFDESDANGLWKKIGPDPIIGDTWRRWNPLESDGDALRLAVKLGFLHRLYICNNGEKVIFGDDFTVHTYETGDDTLAATRRAIVRAAAEIGKSK